MVALAVLCVSREAVGLTCTVGKPCGNACISVADTCHIGSSSGGGDGEVLGLVLMGAGAAFGLGGLISGSSVDQKCAPVSPQSICWPRFAQYSAYAVGLGLVIAGLVVFLDGKSATSGAGLAPAMVSLTVPL